MISSRYPENIVLAFPHWNPSAHTIRVDVLSIKLKPDPCLSLSTIPQVLYECSTFPIALLTKLSVFSYSPFLEFLHFFLPFNLLGSFSFLPLWVHGKYLVLLTQGLLSGNWIESPCKNIFFFGEFVP